jgi:iron complex outermembrane receptor protein
MRLNSLCRPARALTALLPLLLAPPQLLAESLSGAVDATHDVLVLATRQAANPLDVPAAEDRIDGAALRDGAGVNLSEAFGPVPGVSVQNRGNYAQDLQISIRGFGARSSFGARGLRLYADGIPATMPDGQGQYSHFDLTGADHIDILRGPFSALYGNAAGGVIAITTADAPAGLGLTATAEDGSEGFRRYGLRAGDGKAASNWTVDAAHFETNGYRTHSSASRSTANARGWWKVGSASTLTVVGNAVETPFVEDPLGLTASQLAADPTQAGTNAIAYNTRKSLGQQQAGVSLETRWSEADSTFLSAYTGHRHSVQYQAILKSVEALATHPGGVIDLGRRYAGGEARLTDRRAWWGVPVSINAGVTVDDLTEDRLGFLNYVGSTLGVEGALRRHDDNRADTVDEYVEADWASPDGRWVGLVGVRHTSLAISSTPLLTPGASVTRVDYGATNPVAGLTWRLARHWSAYLSSGRGFETPTLNDLAYRSTDGTVTGLNTALRPARSTHTETGLKLESGAVSGTLSVFRIHTEDELAVQANTGGRSVLENIGPTLRRGVELALTDRWTETLAGTLAYTALDARTEASYRACSLTPCVPSVVPAGSRLPAVPRNALYAGLTQRLSPAMTLTAETVGRSGLYADDRNTAFASGYWTSNLRLSGETTVGTARVHGTLRLDNLFDRRYIGTVIVNETNGRYYEPSAGHTLLLIVSVDLR